MIFSFVPMFENQPYTKYIHRQYVKETSKETSKENDKNLLKIASEEFNSHVIKISNYYDIPLLEYKILSLCDRNENESEYYFKVQFINKDIQH